MDLYKFSDVQAVGKGVSDLNINGFQLKLIGSEQRFIVPWLDIY